MHLCERCLKGEIFGLSKEYMVCHNPPVNGEGVSTRGDVEPTNWPYFYHKSYVENCPNFEEK